jgi:hypothetical protein
MDAAELRRRLEGAAAGLRYLSEGDDSFTFVSAPANGEEPLNAEGIARAFGASPGSPVEEVTLDRFFAGHIEESDPNDPIAQAEMERFRSLKQTLQESLEEVHVVRVGEVEVRCYVVGRGASGDLAGLVTTAWES